MEIHINALIKLPRPAAAAVVATAAAVATAAPLLLLTLSRNPITVTRTHQTNKPTNKQYIFIANKFSRL